MNNTRRNSPTRRLPALLVIAALCGAVWPWYAVLASADDDDHAGEHANEERLAMTPEQIKYAALSLNQAGPALLRETLPLYGQVVPDAEREHSVSARYPGIIQQVAKKVGDPVSQGEALAMVESNESLKRYPVVASLSGVVVQRQANVGEQTGDRTLFVIGDYSIVWVNLAVFPRDLAKIRAGQRVQVKGSDDGVAGEGAVIAVSPVGNSSNQTITATAALDNADGKWVPGQFVRAEVVVSESEVPLAVTEGAIQIVDDKRVVFVAEGESFEVRPVALGRSDGRIIEVLAGLRAGETYVSGNSFVLKSELGKEGADHGH